jgi:hypothetical protein
MNNHDKGCWCSLCQQEWKTSRGATRQQIGEQLDEDRALKQQVGGDHYRRLKIQPVEYIIANGIGFLAGNIIKYASRHAYKGGADDIRKIKHYCDLILEFEYGVGSAVSSNVKTVIEGLGHGEANCQNQECDPDEGIRRTRSQLSDRE